MDAGDLQTPTTQKNPLTDNRLLWALLLLSLAFSVSPSHAQRDPLNQPWRWSHYDTDSGLPHGQLSGVVETIEGQFWVSTPRGVAWFDGFAWQPAHQIPGFPSEGLVQDIDTGPQGGLYVALNERLYHGDTTVFRSIPLIYEQDTLKVRHLYPLPDHGVMIWASDGLYIHRNATTEPIPLPDGVSDMRERIYMQRSSEGSIWISNTTMSAKWHGDRWEKHLDIGLHYVYEDSLGGIITSQHAHTLGTWYWTPGGLLQRLESANNQFIIAAAVGPERKTILVYSNGDVRHYRQGAWHLLEEPLPQLRNAHRMHFTRDKRLWVTSADGLWLYRGSRQRWLPNTGLERPERIHALLERRNGETWAATAHGLLVQYPAGHTDHIIEVNGEPLDVVSTLAEDAAGGVWIGSNASFPGAFRWYQNRWQHYDVDDGLDAPRLHKIVPDRQGRLWFLAHALERNDAIEDPGLFVYDSTGFKRWSHAESLLDNRVYDFTEDVEGTLWFGSQQGLSRWKNEEWTHWTDLLSHQHVFDLVAGPDNRLWFAAKGDLSILGYINNQDQVVYLRDEAERMKEVSNLTITLDNTLWIASPNGLWRYQNGALTQFDADDGLATERVGALLVQPDRVLVGTLGAGVMTLSLEEATTPPPIVRIAPPLFENQTTHFRWQPFAFQGARRPEHIETRFRLDDQPWSTWNQEREMSAHNLSPGHHTFAVQTKSLFGNVAPMGTAISFSVPYPFYRHPLFLFGVAIWILSLIGVGWAYWRKQQRFVHELAQRNVAIHAQNKELEAQNAELERFTYTVSHDLKSPLVTIKGFLGLLEQDIANNHKQQIETDFLHINAATDKMGQLLDDLLELSRIGRVANPTETLPLRDLAQDALHLLNESITTHNVTINLARLMPTVRGDRIRLVEVFQNLIENAIKFRQEAVPLHITIGIRPERNNVVCYVQDNGIGIDSAYHDQIFGLFNRLSTHTEGTGIGLALVKRIVEVHSGTIWVESAGVGHGATFCFRLPLAKIQPPQDHP